MDYKKTNAPSSTVTRDMMEFVQIPVTCTKPYLL